MKLFVLAFVVLFGLHSYANEELVPTGVFTFSSGEFSMARHNLILYNASSEDMRKMQQLRADGYTCKRFSRKHLCKKTVYMLPTNLDVKFDPLFETLVFSEEYKVSEVVIDAVVNQYLITQKVQYDEQVSENESYNSYAHENGEIYLDPELSTKVRFKYVNQYLLSQQLIKNKTISRKESYTIFYRLDFVKN